MTGFLIRWAFAFVLLAATYNPTEYCYTRWAMANWEIQLPLTVLFGLVLLVGYVVFLRATFRSIGLLGLLLVLALVSAVIWVVYDFGWINFENPTMNTWLAIVVLSFTLSIGLIWSIVRHKLSGQVDVDDVDE